MAKIANITEAVMILNPGNTEYMNLHLDGADHDVIYLPSDPDAELTDEQEHRLDELGAHLSDTSDGWEMFA